MKYFVIRYISGAMSACEQSPAALDAAFADKAVLCFVTDIEVPRIADAVPLALHRIVEGDFELSAEGQRICNELAKPKI